MTSESLVWEHNPWESVVRDFLHGYDFVSTDEVLRHVLSYVSEDASEASKILQGIYEVEYSSFMDIMSEILENIGEQQTTKDIWNDTDYSWEKGV